MHFIFGGRGMGMLEYAKELVKEPKVCDLAAGGPENLPGANILVNAHLLVKRLISNGEDAQAYFRRNMNALHDNIIVGDEVGGGIVPEEPFERLWRDEVGWVYQLLAAEADDVTRVWAGIPQTLKRGGRVCG